METVGKRLIKVQVVRLAGTGVLLGGNSEPRARVSDSITLAVNNLLQFKAGGQVLGFLPNEVYLASLDQALRVEFMGAWMCSARH